MDKNSIPWLPDFGATYHSHCIFAMSFYLSTCLDFNEASYKCRIYWPEVTIVIKLINIYNCQVNAITSVTLIDQCDVL